MDAVYDPKTGFMVFWDLVAHLPRDHKRLQIVFGCYNNERNVSENRSIPMREAEIDPEFTNFNRVVFDTPMQIKNVQPHPNSNLVLEC